MKPFHGKAIYNPSGKAGALDTIMKDFLKRFNDK
jgi:hypothetical protein